jgi:hypothetical protein
VAVSIRKLTLWRTEVEHRPGALSELLEPLSAAGADLQIVMGYRIPGQKGRAVVEVAPVGTASWPGRPRAAASPRAAPPPSSWWATTGRASPTASPGPSRRAASTSPSSWPRWSAGATRPFSGSRTRPTSTRRPTASALPSPAREALAGDGRPACDLPRSGSPAILGPGHSERPARRGPGNLGGQPKVPIPSPVGREMRSRDGPGATKCPSRRGRGLAGVLVRSKEDAR